MMMKKLSRFCPLFLLALAAVLLMSGCGTSIHTSTVRFHQFSYPANPVKAGTYAFYPVSEAQADSLEYASYCDLVARELVRYGWKRVESAEGADYRIAFQYGINNGEVVSSSSPIYGQTGGGMSFATGTVSSPGGGFGSFSGNVFTPPTYGQVGTSSSTSIYYKRVFDMEIMDNVSKKKIYEGQVVSVGSNAQIAAVMPVMIKSMFRDFPGKSGKPQNMKW